MEKDKEVSIKIQIWDNKDEGMFYYKTDENYKSEKKYFNFELNDANFYLIKTKDNKIKLIKEHKEFNSKEDEKDEILFRMRKSFKSKIYEVINPIKINKGEYRNNYLNDKIWYTVKSSTNSEGNNQNYILNQNDIIKLGRKKYIVLKIHFKEEKGKIKDINFNKNSNISYISFINKKSKSIFNIDIEINQYIINNNNDYKKINEDENDDICKKETFPESGNKKKSTNEREIKNESINVNGNKSDTLNGSGNNNAFYESRIKYGTIYEVGNKNGTINESGNKNKYNKCWRCNYLYSDKENPLVCLCDCHDYIHYECLKNYLDKKKIITENFKETVKTFMFKQFNCDICLKPYRLRFRIPEFDKIYELIDLTLPEEIDYICLESLDYIKDNNNNNDIIDNDISISKEHALLRINKNNGNLFLEDKNSKFGTLVLVRGNVKIKEEQTYFQIGKIYMEVKEK